VATDAHIAATAIEDGVPLLTANERHYRVLPDLALEIFRP
jgi:predicted nucleic acid-binding protein